MHDKESFRSLIHDQLASLREQESDSTGSAATVELDQSRVGRLSRMDCLLYTSPSPRDATLSRMPSSA